ncbi:MAG: PqqD family protein [Deltaproteobacteria bacterium]|nr:PqqD family protein [Deltaproteobacteria bacterium]
MKVSNPKNTDARLPRTDALQFTPVKNIEVTAVRLESGVVLLSYPMKFRPWFGSIIRRLGRGSNKTWTKKVELDDLGTAVWDLIDGKLTVGQLIQKFAEKYQLHSKEAEVAVTQFLRELGRRGIIGMR